MIRSLAFGAALFAAGPATALSCSPATVAGAYTHAAQSPDDYVIGVGSLLLTGPSNPPEGAVAQGGDINQMVGFTQPAQFAGDLFTGQGFNNSQVLPVTVDVICFSAWCGSASSIDDGMYFFRVVNGAYILDQDPCPGSAFADPHPGMLEEIVLCHAGSCPGVW